MKTQFYADRGGVVRLYDGAPLRIDHRGGELAVVRGRVWITRAGDLDDHVLDAGQSMLLRSASAVVVEQWRATESAVVEWYPRPAESLAGAPRGIAAYGLRGLAFAADATARGLRGAAGRFAALARSAASMARRAQGCISAGDSMASAGTVQ
jgi:hypothetical protein